jgi:PadR family transcriptional regulator PadR
LTEKGMAVDEGTLYPLLRRMESQGLLTSEWREEEKRSRRFYRLSLEGKRVLGRLTAEWEALTASLAGIIKESNDGSH